MQIKFFKNLFTAYGLNRALQLREKRNLPNSSTPVGEIFAFLHQAAGNFILMNPKQIRIKTAK
jgi:hypothetical protein